MEKEHIIMQMKTNILDNGLKIRKMVMESFIVEMELFMMVNGLMTNQLTKDKLHIQIKINMKELS